MTILIKNQQNFKRLNRKKIEKTALTILSLLEQPATELSILFVDDKEMKKLNTLFRGIRKSTDVLSFPQIETGRGPKSARVWQARYPSPVTRHCILGDIVISTQRADIQAKNSGAGFYDEISRLLIHGVLHLLGYNHEKSPHKAKTMKKKEEELLNAVKKMD